MSSSGTGKACGTPYWMAPEVLRGEATTTSSDVYAFAIILYEVFSRKDPYPVDADLETVLKEVVKRKPKKSCAETKFADLMMRTGAAM